MPTFIVIIIIGVLASVGFVNNKINQNDIANKLDKNITISIFPTASPHQTETITPSILPKTDTDPIVSCNISPECGGGQKTMRRSECRTTTCCQVGKQWSRYPNEQSCTNAQKAYHDELLTQLKQKRAIDEAQYKALLEEIRNSTSNSTATTNTYSIDYSVPKPTVYSPADYPTITPYQIVQDQYVPKPVYLPPERRTGTCTPIGNDGKNVICENEANSLRPLN